MAVLFYIIKLILASGLLYGYYFLFLRNKQFHRYNRFYLLMAVLASVIIPFIKIPVIFPNIQGQEPLLKTLRVVTISGWEEPVTIYANLNRWHQWFTLQNLLYGVYLLGVAFSLAVLLRSLFYIIGLRKKYEQEEIFNIKFYNTQEEAAPFSFFNTVFWHAEIPLHTKQGQQVWQHEVYHVKEKHSLDIIIIELLCSIAWFNPFFHFIKKELKAIHEFLADEYAMTASNKYEYAELLVMQAIKRKNAGLTNHFFNNQIKRRITMITNFSNIRRRSGYISRIAALPLLFILVSAFAVKLTSKSGTVSSTPVTIVIDAGHGGIYTGATSANGVHEKDINLGIARKIKELSGQYNVNVIMTRTQDGLVGNATTLKDDLLNRVTLSNKSNADLFISIHVNADTKKQTTRSGFEAIISGKQPNAKAGQLASVLLGNLKSIYTSAEIVSARPATAVTVLDKSNCPAVILECGYLNNPADVAFITDNANQEKIARSILEAATRYKATEKQPSADVIATNDKEETMDVHNTVEYYQDSILSRVEIEADYPGGKTAWINYLVKNVKYPADAVKKNIQGTVIVEFVVNKDGKVGNIKAISGPKELYAESVRIIKDSGKWLAGMQNGKKVNVFKKQPITYKLAG
jgi:TonB family protein